MATTSKYFILTPGADNLNLLDFDLRYGTITTVGQTIQYNGSSKVDSVVVRPGLIYDLTNTAASNDKVYLAGNLADYTQATSGNLLTLSRSVNAQTESITLTGGTSLVDDTLVFADGTVSVFSLHTAVKNSTALPTPSAAETFSTPQGAAAAQASLNAVIKAFSVNPAAVGQVAETFVSTPPGISLFANGGNDIDTVYVADGETVNASVLGASVDLVYFRGRWADYTKAVVSSGTLLVFTRSIGGHLESVTVTAGTALNYDRLIFADGAINTNDAKDRIVTDPTGPGPTDPGTVTPLYPDDAVAAALNEIRDAAQNNNATASTPAAIVYTTAGALGVNASNLASISSALNSAAVTGAQADTSAEVQAIVDAYTAILASADGTPGNTSTALTGTQYATVGVTGVSGSATAGSALALLDDVVDLSASAAVDTVPELQALALAASHAISGAAGGTSTTLADLTVLGITGVTSTNLPYVQTAIAATADNGTGVDTQAELQALVTASVNGTTTLSSALENVANLDVTSNLVISADHSISVGSGFIHITDLGGPGYQGDTHTNTQSIDVATAVADGLLSVTGAGTNTKIVINPLWDLDLASNYQLSVDDGAFVIAGGTSAVLHFDSINFSTVTPGTHSAGTAAGEAAASQTMLDATGALVAGRSWLDIQGIGNNTGSVSQLGDLSGSDFALVLKNYATTRGGDAATGGDGTDGIATLDTNVGVTHFGDNDIVYFDSQVNNTATQFFDARYTGIIDGANRGGLAGQNGLVFGLVSTPQQSGSTAMVLLGLEGNLANTIYPAIFSLPDGTVGWATVWHSGSAPAVMG